MTKDLILQVRKIDRQAALWMEKKAARMKGKICLELTDSLCRSFVWSLTPQGSEYWLNIAVHLPYEFS